MKKRNIHALIHGFALLHAVTVAVCAWLGLPDPLPLTALTILMAVILCYMENLTVEITLSAVILVNVVGFLLGNLGAQLVFGALPGAWQNVVSTVVVTELLGWSLYLFANAFSPSPAARHDRQISWKKHRWVLIISIGVLFALMTGLRIGEVCALRAGDINMAEKTVTVRETVQRIKNLDGNSSKTKIVFTTPKSNTSVRVVPLTNTAYMLCKINTGKTPPNAFLLTGKEDKVIEPRTLQYHIKRYSMACGIEDMHFHVLRHTFATRCVEVGFEIKSLSEVLGHSSPQITLERYVHSSLELKRQNMTKLEAIGW